jgi:ubiquinone/menaquinone biosynthesis C-methylase UbiE
MWFLNTETWGIEVVARAIADLERLIVARRPSYPTVLDVGCGTGRALPLLRQRFVPERLLGIDVEPAMLVKAQARAAAAGIAVELAEASCFALPFADASVDLLFCHQTFHHLTDQGAALREFRRVLKPGGLLLFAESTKVFIESWIIRLLFRHPADAQHSAGEFLGMIRDAGFRVDADAVSYPYLWWSRADLGLLERLGIPPRAGHEETLVNAVAIRP